MAAPPIPPPNHPLDARCSQRLKVGTGNNNARGHRAHSTEIATEQLVPELVGDQKVAPASLRERECLLQTRLYKKKMMLRSWLHNVRHQRGRKSPGRH